MGITRRVRGALGTALLGFLLALVVLPGDASAHERRELLGGKYRAAVGFLDEPAVEQQLNAVYLNVVSLKEQGADGKEKPIEGLEKTLKVEVILGGGAQKREMVLKPRSGQPGQYVADFIPTRAGEYTFRFFGDINGEQIDERFESGPGRFTSVAPVSELQFPAPAAETANLQGQIDTARFLGIGGLVVGLLGLGVGAFALLRRPAAGRDTGAASAPRPSTGG